MAPRFLKKKGACGNVPTNSGLPEIWGPFFWKKKGACGNVVSRSGLPKNPKNENSQNQNPFCPKCRQYFLKPEKEPPGPIWGHPGPFFAWAGKSKNFAYFPWWALAAIHPRWGYWYFDGKACAMQDDFFSLLFRVWVKSGPGSQSHQQGKGPLV